MERPSSAVEKPPPVSSLCRRASGADTSLPMEVLQDEEESCSGDWDRFHRAVPSVGVDRPRRLSYQNDTRARY